MDFTVVDKEEGVEDVTSLLYLFVKMFFQKKKKKKKEKRYDFLNFTCILFPLFLLIVRIYGRLVVLPLPLLSETWTYKPL